MTIDRSARFAAVPLLLVALLFARTFSGHSDATGIVKERMDLMKEMGDASRVIGDMVKRKRPLDATDIAALAE